MRLEIAPITDISSLAHVSPTELVALMKIRAPRLVARAKFGSSPTLEQLAALIRGIQPEDEADDFLEDLHLVARICLHDGAEDLLVDKGISLAHVSLGDALVRASLESRTKFDAIADHATVAAASKGSTFTLFSPREHRTDLEMTPALTEAVRTACASFFDDLGQGSHCEVRFYVEHDETGFLIDHAGARRTERLINELEKPEVRRYRPFRHDVILLERKSGKLRILARSEKERVFYANLAGELLAGKKNYFVAREAYVLDAIAGPNYSDVLTELVDREIERVALRELRMVGEDDLTTRHVLVSNDVLSSLRASGLTLDTFIPRQASFSIVPRIRKGRRCYRLTIWKGNRIKCDAPWSDRVVNEIVARLRLRRDAA